jgi:Spy/CpxP family protein refolding chaperone
VRRIAFALMTLVSVTACARAPEGQGDAPDLSALRPHEVPQQIVGLREELGLTDEQASRLDELHVAIRDEQHQYAHSGGKPHSTVHQAMVTREQAYTDAMAILTPEQRPKAVELLTTLPETVKVPPALQALTPQEIVQRVRSHGEHLALRPEQVRELEQLEVMIRDEKHRYSHQAGRPHQTTHQQMITRGQAFADAMAILTPEQRREAISLLLADEA